MRLLESINDLDVNLFLRCVNRLARIACQISRSGDGYMQVLLPLLVYTAVPEDGQAVILCVLLGFVIELPVYWLLKNSFQRRRPPEAIPAVSASIIASDRFSFPSGHTAAACLLCTVFTLFFGSAAIPLMFWAAAVGASRVLLGVHFPTDILAGALLGSSVAIFSYSMILG